MQSHASHIFRHGRLENGNHFTATGRARNGSVEEISEDIIKFGQDTIVVLPRFNVVGVFDGAGGTTDIGSPEKAAITAAQAVKQYFSEGGDDVPAAMEFARNAVKNDQTAGLCVGALARFCEEIVQTVNAGDASIVCYDTSQETLAVIAEQQMEFGQPTNYLGRHADRIALPIADVAASYQQPYDSEREVYVLSDGALGNWQFNTALEAYHFRAAHHEYQLLAQAGVYDKSLEENIRKLLIGSAGDQLREQQTEDYGYMYRPELDDPLRFSADSFDWDVWEKIVQPYIQTLHLPQAKLSARVVCESLLARPICWPFERSPDDDASIVMIEPVKGTAI